MKIETKYNIGDRLFFIELDHNQYEVKLCEIKQINIGGRFDEKYVITGGFYGKTRAEGDLYTSFEDAKKEAIKKQILRNEDLLKTITEQKEPTRV